jgi:hypothetical protein
MTETGDNLVLGLASATGTSDTVTLEVTDGGVVLDILNLDAAGVETLDMTMKDTTHSTTVDVAGLTATGTSGTSTINVLGAGATILNGINATTDTIDASTATGALTVAAAQRTADAKTIKGGTAGDSIAMEASADVLSGGLGTDSLVVDYTAVMGGIAVDLSAADQVTTMEGSANAAVQSGFENVDLSAYDSFGSTVTGSDGANVITGTALADNISAGKGNDTIKVALTADGNTDIMNGGAGTDTLELTGAAHDFATDANLINIENITAVSSANVDVSEQSEDLAITVTDSAANLLTLGAVGLNTVTNFEINSDTLNFDSIAGISSNGVATAANATKVNIANGAVYVHADGADGTGTGAASVILDYTDLTDVAAFLSNSYSYASGEKAVFVINDTAADHASVYLAVGTATGAATIEAAEVTYIGQLNDVGTTVLDVNEVT